MKLVCLDTGICCVFVVYNNAGVDPEGEGAPGARPPKYGKNMIFWRKILIFHTKYHNKFRASLRSAQFFLNAPL